MSAALPPWDPDEHDREIKAQRQRERAERSKSWRKGGHERGELTPEHLKRREAMDRAMQRRANGNGEN